LQPFAVESCGFHQNVQKLTGNIKNGHILNTVLNILCFAVGKGTTLKASIPATWLEKFAKKRTLQN